MSIKPDGIKTDSMSTSWVSGSPWSGADYFGGSSMTNSAPHPTYSVEINSDEDGRVEEVILRDSERLLVHLERESRDTWWLGIYPEADSADAYETDACFDIFRAKKRVEVEKR